MVTSDTILNRLDSDMICLVLSGDHTKGGADSLAVSSHGDCGKVSKVIYKLLFIQIIGAQPNHLLFQK